jgi:hypothetical protein
MKHRIIAAVALCAILSSSAVLQVDAATVWPKQKPVVSWVDRAIAWFSQALPPLSALWEKSGSRPTPPSGDPSGTTLDGGGCLDPHGGACN